MTPQEKIISKMNRATFSCDSRAAHQNRLRAALDHMRRADTARVKNFTALRDPFTGRRLG